MKEEKEIPTALQIQDKFLSEGNHDIEAMMIEFAKLHVNMALEMASIDAQQVVYDGHPHLLKDNIINSYPESNIK